MYCLSNIIIITERFTGDVECILSHSAPPGLIVTYISLGTSLFILIYTAYTLILVKFYKHKRTLQRNHTLHNRRRNIFVKDTTFSTPNRDIDLTEGCLTNGPSTPGSINDI